MTDNIYMVVDLLYYVLLYFNIAATLLGCDDIEIVQLQHRCKSLCRSSPFCPLGL